VGFGWLNSQSTVDLIVEENDTVATHLGRAVFDGRFSDLELRDLQVRRAAMREIPAAAASGLQLVGVAAVACAVDIRTGCATAAAAADNQADPDLVGDSA